MLRPMTALLPLCLSLALLSCRGDTTDSPATSTPVLPPTATAQPVNVRPTPTAENGGRYTPTVLATGIPALDQTLLAFQQRGSKAEGLASLAALLATLCSPTGESGPPCGDLPQGTEIPSFLIDTSLHDGYLTEMASVRSVIEREIGSHAAWALYAVSYPVPGDPITEGYVIGLRAATGNTGLLWYATLAGAIVAVRGSGDYFNGKHPEITYICGPSYGPITCGS